MNDWMILQAQMHQGQSHFASAHTRAPDMVEPESGAQAVTDSSLFKPQGHQPSMHGVEDTDRVF